MRQRPLQAVWVQVRIPLLGTHPGNRGGLLIELTGFGLEVRLSGVFCPAADHNLAAYPCPANPSVSCTSSLPLLPLSYAHTANPTVTRTDNSPLGTSIGASLAAIALSLARDVDATTFTSIPPGGEQPTPDFAGLECISAFRQFRWTSAAFWSLLCDARATRIARLYSRYTALASSLGRILPLAGFDTRGSRATRPTRKGFVIFRVDTAERRSILQARRTS
jgi:hypothetical protein